MAKVNAMLDPRGYQERPMLQLAKRPSLAELKKGKILFYNNTKLGFCNYYTVFDRIKERLREIGCDDSKWVEYTETVRGKNAEKLGEYAAMLAKEKPVAAIVAFGQGVKTTKRLRVNILSADHCPGKAGYPRSLHDRPSGNRHHRGRRCVPRRRPVPVFC